MNGHCIAPWCGARAVHDHHVLTRQLLRREGGDIADPRNLVPLCLDCHAAHHSRQRPLPLRALPDSVFEFAEELVGAGTAYELLRRTYVGEDARLERTLHRWHCEAVGGALLGEGRSAQ